MANTSSNDSAPRRKKYRITVFATATLLLSMVFIGGLLVLQHKASNRNSTLHGITQIEPEQSEKNRKATLVKADELRDKWKSWALEHKEPLSVMLHSSTTAQSAFQDVRDSLPAATDLVKPVQPKWKSPIANNDLGSFFVKASNGLWRPNPDANVVAFAWHIPPRISNEDVLKRMSKELDKNHYLKGQEAMIRREQKNFATFHDIEIASGSNEGFTVSLWASGRVTEQKWPVGRERATASKTKNHLPWNAPFREISPPYDFLK